MSAVINGDSFNGSISVESRARTSFVLEREREREREYPHTVMDGSGHRREICVGSNEFSNGSSDCFVVVCAHGLYIVTGSRREFSQNSMKTCCLNGDNKVTKFAFFGNNDRWCVGTKMLDESSRRIRRFHKRG